MTDVKAFLHYKKKDRGSVTLIANRLGNPGLTGCEWLILTPKENMPKPEVVSFPKPPKAPDGSLLYDRIPNKVVEPEKFVLPNIGCTIITPTSLSATTTPEIANVPTPHAATTTTIKRRAYEMNGGSDGKFLSLVLFSICTVFYNECI